MDYIISFVLFISLGLLDAVQADLSVLAPEIICPEGGNNTLSRPDNSLIRILSETDTDMNVSWSVSWSPISVMSQRLTIMAWQSVRDLDKKLNGPKAEPLLSVIKNDELVSGVNYILKLTANASNEIFTKSFSIKFNQNNQDATVSTNDTFSVTLLGGRSACPDVNYIIEADITTCSITQDYYFIWEMFSTTFEHFVNTSNIIGSRLEVPRFILRPGYYEVKCQLRNESDHELIKEVRVQVQVNSCGLHVYLSVDHLIVSTYSIFTIESIVVNRDYENYSVEYEWQCFYKGESCNFVEKRNDVSLNFSSGIPKTGVYLITLTVTTPNQSANANATIVVVAASSPILQIKPVPRVINQGTSARVSGIATRVASFCRVIWYFATEEYDTSSLLHGVAISETYTVFSLEENFLSELTDFSNDTESVEIEVEITTAGRARFVAECNCSTSYDCESEVTLTYAEIHFQLNESPQVEQLVVSPETGSSLETMFQIRTRAKDADKPLLYSFYCAIGPNMTLLLGSYLEYDTIETFLPFIEGETVIWVEVCDTLGACSKSEPSVIHVRPSSGNTFDLLVQYARAFIRRCEIVRLIHVAISGFVSYKNAGQLELAELFTRALLESLPGLPPCPLPQRYAGIVGQLAAGLDVTHLLA